MTDRIDFEVIFNSSSNPYMLLDRDLNFVAVNDAYLQVTSQKRERLIGRNLFEVFPGNPDDPDDSSVRLLRGSLRRVLKERKPDTLALIRYPILRTTRDGIQFEERFWSATHTPIFNEQGEVCWILQHTVDVTELLQLKKALRAAEATREASLPSDLLEEGVFHRAQIVQEANRILDAERRLLLTLFKQAPGFIAVLQGPQHVFQLVNEAYYQIIGRRDIVGKPILEAMPEVKDQGFVELLDRVYTSGEPFVGRGLRIFLRRPPENRLEPFFVDFVYQPITNTDGSVSGIFVQGSDVTEQILAQKELERLNKSLEQRVTERTAELEKRNRELQQFAYVASHDLQEPLRKIQTFADLMKIDYGARLDEEGKFFLDRIQNAASRMSQLLSDLLAFSRVATRSNPFVWTNVEAVVNEVLSDMDMTIASTGAEFDIEADVQLEADPYQLRQLLNHLILNAVKFRREGVSPHIRITVETMAREEGTPVCRISVVDNGIGFDASFVDRIFEPFERLHGRTQYPGTGMGLAISRRIVERHGGRISAESVPNQGSRFTVDLPVHQNGKAERAGVIMT